MAAFALATQQIESLLEQASGAAAKGAAGDGGRQRQGSAQATVRARRGTRRDLRRCRRWRARGGVHAAVGLSARKAPRVCAASGRRGRRGAQVFDGEDEERHTRILGEEAENMVKDAKAVMQAGREQRLCETGQPRDAWGMIRAGRRNSRARCTVSAGHSTRGTGARARARPLVPLSLSHAATTREGGIDRRPFPGLPGSIAPRRFYATAAPPARRSIESNALGDRRGFVEAFACILIKRMHIVISVVF